MIIELFFILKGLWRGGHWELNWPHCWIFHHVSLNLVTNFQLCISIGCREQTRDIANLVGIHINEPCVWKWKGVYCNLQGVVHKTTWVIQILVKLSKNPSSQALQYLLASLHKRWEKYQIILRLISWDMVWIRKC